MNSLCLRWLADPVQHSSSGWQNLRNLNRLVRFRLGERTRYPKLESLLQTEKNYLVRDVASTLGMLAEKVDEGDITETLFPIAKAAAADSAANVRFNIAKSLEKMARAWRRERVRTKSWKFWTV